MSGRLRQDAIEHEWQDAAYVDAWIAQRIDGDPSHQQRLARLAAIVAAAVGRSDPRVLDVGTGPGALAEPILRAIPNATVVCQDFSAAMLDRARASLAWAPERVRFHESDLRSPGWQSGLEPGFDAVVSSYALHNLRTPARMEAVYADLVDLLARGGGCLFVLDLVESPGPRTDVVYGRTRRHADDDVVTLDRELGWLRALGLVEVDCIWKDGFEAAVCGFRA